MNFKNGVGVRRSESEQRRVRLAVGIEVRVAGCTTGRETKPAATYIVCTLAGPLKDVIRHHDLGRQELRAVEIMILGFNTDSTPGPVSVRPARVRVDFFRDARSRELETKRARPAILQVSNSRPVPPSPPSSPPWGGPRLRPGLHPLLTHPTMTTIPLPQARHGAEKTSSRTGRPRCRPPRRDSSQAAQRLAYSSSEKSCSFLQNMEVRTLPSREGCACS